MTEDKQSNNNKEKVSFILVVQDLDRITAATYDTSYNVEQHKGALKHSGTNLQKLAEPNQMRTANWAQTSFFGI